MNHAIQRTWNYGLNIFNELDFSYPSIMNLLSNTLDVMEILCWDILFILSCVSEIVYFTFFILCDFLFKYIMNLLLDLSNMTCENMVIHRLSFISSLHVPKASMPVSFLEFVYMSNSKIITNNNIFKFFFLWEIVICA